MSFDDLFRMLRTLRTRLKRTTQAKHSIVTNPTLESNRLDQVYIVIIVSCQAPPASATNNLVPFNTIQQNRTLVIMTCYLLSLHGIFLWHLSIAIVCSILPRLEICCGCVGPCEGNHRNWNIFRQLSTYQLAKQPLKNWMFGETTISYSKI